MIPKRFAVQQFDKPTKQWFDVEWKSTFADAMMALNVISRDDANAGKWYRVQPVTELAVA